MIRITESGTKLREKALKVPEGMSCRINKDNCLFDDEECAKLKDQLYRIIETLN